MAKRFPVYKEFGRSTKKPKLDVSISKGRPLGPSQTWPNQLRTNAIEVGFVGEVGGRNAGLSDNNFWDDDDDDDVILLATQVAESQVEMYGVAAGPPPSLQIETRETELTFSEFAPQVHATTSTQFTAKYCAPNSTNNEQPATKTMTSLDKNNLSQLFDDDFLEIFTNASNSEEKQETPNVQKPEADGITEDIFKKPTTVVSRCNGLKNGEPLLSSGIRTQSSQNTRRQVATERQVQMLMERLDALKAENSKLTNDLNESKAKIESKAGESSLLRDELRHMKQQMQALKMEKIMSTEAAKSECKTKIAELAKRVEAKESELKLRNVEYSVLKMRHADETQRLEISMRGANNVGAEVPVDKDKAQVQSSKRKLYGLRSLNLNTCFKSQSEGFTKSRFVNLSARAYDSTEERGTSKQRHTPFQQALANVQTLLAQLYLEQQKNSWTSNEALNFIKHTNTTASSAILEFWTYVHSLEFPKQCHIHPYHDYELCKDVPTRRCRDLHAAQELHADERAISLRRYIAALSIICGQMPMFAQQLVQQQHGDCALLQIACQAISKLGYSREVCVHFGTLEAFAKLLRELLSQLRADKDQQHFEMLIHGLLKQLIFARPSAWIFRELSGCLLELRRLPAALELLCVNSDASTFYSDRMRSLYRFTNDSCILQVYTGLLEIAFPLNGLLSEPHMRLLADVCENHIRFAHFCFINPPQFIHKLLPSYDDDDVEHDGDNDVEMEEQRAQANSTDDQTSNEKSVGCCECYTKLCLSVVTILFQLMRQWVYSGRNFETSHVAEVSQIAVQLLHIIFCDNYSTRLFRYAEETTKHYLWLICEWWSEHANLLKFHHVHKNFLNKLRTFHIMPKLLKDEGNVSNLMNDLNEWHTLANNTSTTAKENNSVDDVGNLGRLAAEKLNLMGNADNELKFFEGLKGYAFNFQ